MDKVSEKGQRMDGHSRINHKQPESKSDRIIIHDKSSIDSTSLDYKLELIRMNTEEIQRLSLPEKQNEDKMDTTPCEGMRDVQEEDDSRIRNTDTNMSENYTIGSKEALLACLNLSKDADTSFLDPLFNCEVRDWDDENKTWDRLWRRHHTRNSEDEVHVLTTKNLRSRKVTVMKMMEPKKQKKSRKRKSENSMNTIEESETIEDSIEKLPLIKLKRKRRKRLTYSKKKKMTHYASNKESENLDESKKEENEEMCQKDNNTNDTENDKLHPKSVEEQESAEMIPGERNEEENKNFKTAMGREEKSIKTDQNMDGEKVSNPIPPHIVPQMMLMKKMKKKLDQIQKTVIIVSIGFLMMTQTQPTTNQGMKMKINKMRKMKQLKRQNLGIMTQMTRNQGMKMMINKRKKDEGIEKTKSGNYDTVRDNNKSMHKDEDTQEEKDERMDRKEYERNEGVQNDNINDEKKEERHDERKEEDVIEQVDKEDLQIANEKKKENDKEKGDDRKYNEKASTNLPKEKNTKEIRGNIPEGKDKDRNMEDVQHKFTKIERK